MWQLKEAQIINYYIDIKESYKYVTLAKVWIIHL